MIDYEKLDEIAGLYFETGEKKYKDQLLLLFLEEDYGKESMVEINKMISNENDFFNFVVFHSWANDDYNFTELRPLTIPELDSIELYKIVSGTTDILELFDYYKIIIMNVKVDKR